MPNDIETPIQRILTSGWAGAATPDLLAVAIAQNERDFDDAKLRALDLLRTLGNIQALADVTREQVRMVTGLSESEAFRCLAWLELGRRTFNAGKGDQEIVMSPQDVAHMLRHLHREKKEHFVVILLDTKNALIKWTTIHIGTLTMSVVGPREVFREAIREGAGSIILAHNHPSGDPEPSPEDIDVTRKLDELGKMLDIKVWDHIILGANDWVSLRQFGAFDGKST